MSTPSFWDDQENAQKVIQETNHLKGSVETFQQLADRLEDLEITHELVKEENDDELLKELNQGVLSLYEDINAYELEHLLNEPYDANKDRKSTRLNSSHVAISYAVFCLKKKKKNDVHE